MQNIPRAPTLISCDHLPLSPYPDSGRFDLGRREVDPAQEVSTGAGHSGVRGPRRIGAPYRTAYS